MSASTFVLLECDVDRTGAVDQYGKPFPPGKCLTWWQATESGASVRAARAAARAEGWRYEAGHPAAKPARDVCPACKARLARELEERRALVRDVMARPPQGQDALQ